jgi:hypothetical protein
MNLFDNTFFESAYDMAAIKFYIDKNELKTILTRSTFFRSIDVEIKSNAFHVSKHLTSNEPIRLTYHFNEKNQLEFISNFMKKLYITINGFTVNRMIIYHDPDHTNGAELLLEKCNLNVNMRFKLEKAYPNQIVF